MGVAGGPGIPVTIDTQHNFGAGQPNADSHKFFAAPHVRIPAGRQYPFYGPIRTVSAAGAAGNDPTGLVGFNDQRLALSHLCTLADPKIRLNTNDACNPGQRLSAYITDLGAAGFHVGGNLLTANNLELLAGFGGFKFKDFQRQTLNTEHSLLKYDGQLQEHVSQLNLVTMAQRERAALAGATHVIVNGPPADAVVASGPDVSRQYKQNTVIERQAGGTMYGFDNRVAARERNMTLLRDGVDRLNFTGDTVMSFNLDGALIDDALTKLRDELPGGILSLLPLQLRFVHDRLVAKPLTADATQGGGHAPYNIPFIPSAAELLGANAADAPELALLEAAGIRLRAEFAARGGDPAILVDGTRMVISRVADNVVVAGVNNVPAQVGPITAAIAAGLALPEPTHYVDAVWDDAFLTSQSIQEGGAAAARMSRLAPFYALGDLIQADPLTRTATTRFDTQSISTATTICNALFRTAMQHPVGTNNVATAAPMNIVLSIRPRDLTLHAANQLEYGVNTAVADGAVAADVAAGGGNANALAAYRDVQGGHGDQFEVPLASLSYPAGTQLRLKGYALTTAPRGAGYQRARYAYIMFPDCGVDLAAVTGGKKFTIVRVNLAAATLRIQQMTNVAAGDPYEMFTCFPDADVYVAATDTYTPLTAVIYAAAVNAANRPPGLQNGGNFLTHCLVQIESNTMISNGLFGLDPYINLSRGLAFRGNRRVSQPLCAPILNPDVRIGCFPPLNFGTRHLPPEMRDFRLELNDVDFSFLEVPSSGSWTFDPLKVYNFAGGNQVATAQDSLLYLPQFQHFESPVDTQFEQMVYSSNGMPSYIAIFCRHTDLGIANNYTSIQPMVETLNIRCDTTKRQSDVVCEDMDKSYLYHMTMRNVHPRSAYNSNAYNMRQVVLLAAEDVGIMGLHAKDYQRVRRVRLEFSGTVNGPGQLHILLIYNNRALEIYGADIKVVRL